MEKEKEEKEKEQRRRWKRGELEKDNTVSPAWRVLS